MFGQFQAKFGVVGAQQGQSRDLTGVAQQRAGGTIGRQQGLGVPARRVGPRPDLRFADVVLGPVVERMAGALQNRGQTVAQGFAGFGLDPGLDVPGASNQRTEAQQG
jgi:hypothetical protein